MTKIVVAATFAIVTTGAVRTACAQARIDEVMPISVDASSTLKGQKETYVAWRAVDWDPVVVGDENELEHRTYLRTTGWCEGKEDEGVGEWLELSGDDLSFRWLEIEAGYWKSEKLFQANNRPTNLTVIITDHKGKETSHDVDVPEDMDAAWLDLRVTDAQAIRIHIAAVAKGKTNDTCISNVRLHGGTTRTLFLDTGDSLQGLLTTITSINDALEQCDAATFETLIKFPMPYRSLPDPSGTDSKAVKTKFRSALAMAKACKKAGAPAPTAEGLNSGVQIDMTRLRFVGPGNYQLASGPVTDAGTVTWHLEYTPPSEGDRGSWRLTAVDYKRLADG